VARNFAPEVGVAASLRPALRAARGRCKLASPESSGRGGCRRARFAQEKERGAAPAGCPVRDLTAQQPMAASVLMAALKRALLEDVIVVGEAITTAPGYVPAFQFERPGDYYGSRGRRDRAGLARRPGVQLAYPKPAVAAISGDGSACSASRRSGPRAPMTSRCLPDPHNRSYRIPHR